MPRVHKMQTAQLVKVKPVRAKTTLESIFNRLASDFGLTGDSKAKPCIDQIKTLKASTNGGDFLDYIRYVAHDFTHAEALNYSGRPLGWPLEIYANSEDTSLRCTVPTSKLMKYRLFLIDMSNEYHDLADKLAVGQFVPEIKVVGRKSKERVFYELKLTDFSEFYKLLANHMER